MSSAVWTDNVSILATQTLARNANVSATIDLRTKRGAMLFPRIGRQGTTALTNGVDFLVRRTLNNNASTQNHPAPIAQVTSQSAAASSTTCSGSDSNSGQKTLNVASTTGFAVGDYILIGGGTAREEWARVSRVTSSTALLLDRNLGYTHTTGQADTVRSKADVFSPVWVDGGATVEVIFDYGDDSAGESVTVECLAQTYDSDS